MGQKVNPPPAVLPVSPIEQDKTLLFSIANVRSALVVIEKTQPVVRPSQKRLPCDDLFLPNLM